MMATETPTRKLRMIARYQLFSEMKTPLWIQEVFGSALLEGKIDFIEVVETRKLNWVDEIHFIVEARVPTNSRTTETGYKISAAEFLNALLNDTDVQIMSAVPMPEAV